MLVLSRKSGQRVLIGGEIAITVVKISGGGVRIGIEAPAEMPIVREELLDKFGLMRESITEILQASKTNRAINGCGADQNWQSSLSTRLGGTPGASSDERG